MSLSIYNKYLHKLRGGEIVWLTLNNAAEILTFLLKGKASSVIHSLSYSSHIFFLREIETVFQI